MASAGPSQRTLNYLKQRKVPCGIVERFVKQAGSFGQRYDLFGFIDLIAIDQNRGIVGIQVTSGSEVSKRVRKIRGEAQSDDPKEIKAAAVRYLRFCDWLATGNPIEVWGWRKVKRNGRDLWQPRILQMHLHHETEENPYE